MHTALIPQTHSVTDTMMSMAKVVDPADPRFRSSRVAWGKWVDGSFWELRRGQDFNQRTELARRAFITWCQRNGYASHTIPDPNDPDVLFVQGIKRIPADVQAKINQLRAQVDEALEAAKKAEAEEMPETAAAQRAMAEVYSAEIKQLHQEVADGASEAAERHRLVDETGSASTQSQVTPGQLTIEDVEDAQR